MKLIIFEDGTHDNFYPVAETRPLSELRAGAFTMHERIEHLAVKNFGKPEIFFNVRSSMIDVAREIYGANKVNQPIEAADTLFVNALYVPFGFNIKPGEMLVSNDRVAAVFLDAAAVKNLAGGATLTKKQRKLPCQFPSAPKPLISPSNPKLPRTRTSS